MIAITTEEKLNERVKELTCLYTISAILRSGDNIESLMPEILKLVKNAWRFSDEAICELQLDNHYMISKPLSDQSVWQEAEITFFDMPNGFIKVHYNATKYKKSDFLDEERRLLRAVALEISRFYENKITKEKVLELQTGMRRVDRLSILGEITAGIAHELNTPLGNILGFAELIKERTTDKQILQDIDKVINASIFSREIVKKLMFFSCEMPYNMEFIKIKPVVEQALRFLEPNFSKAGTNFKFQIADDLLEAQFDSIQFTQVLVNLLVNAIYVSPLGGVVSIDISNDSTNYFIEITDEGKGIPDDVGEKIFEPFFTTKPFGEGTGLGLSVAHGIIKSHRGEITTAQNIPTGTIFRIKLPIKNQV